MYCAPEEEREKEIYTDIRTESPEFSKMFFPVKYYTAKDFQIEIERRISQKDLSSVGIRAKKVEICTWASKQSWREKGKYTKISSHISEPNYLHMGAA